MKHLLSFVLCLLVIVGLFTGCQKDNRTDMEGEQSTSYSEHFASGDMLVPPTQENTSPTQENTSPTQESTSPTQENTSPTQENTSPTQENTPPTQESPNANKKFRYVENQKYDSVPVYFKNGQVFIENAEGDFLEMLECDGETFSWGNPIEGMFAISTGMFYGSNNYGTYEFNCYKVIYNGDVCYVNDGYIQIKGCVVEAFDGKKHKLGEVLYDGKYHDIIIGGDGRYCCTDGCDGILDVWAKNPMFASLENACVFADSCYRDPNTGVEYPLCLKPIYEGLYGTVYCIAKETNDDWGCYEGFHVVRKKEYRKITLDSISSPSFKEELENKYGAKVSFSWRESVRIYTFEDAKLQADSFESVCGSQRLTYMEGAGGS